MNKKTDKTEKLSFEEALERLEDIIKKMETEELPLDESLEIFQEGIKLNVHCRKILNEAEFRVEKLLQDNELEEYNDRL